MTATPTLTPDLSGVNASATPTLTLPEPVPEAAHEFWECTGTACKILGSEFQDDSDDSLSHTENGLIAGVVLLGVVCIALTVVLVLLFTKISALQKLKQDVEDSKKARYEVQKDVAHATDTITAQETILQANVRELQSINGPGPPEGKSTNPLANMQMQPLRNTVNDFHTRLEFLEDEISRQRKGTRESII